MRNPVILVTKAQRKTEDVASFSMNNLVMFVQVICKLFLSHILCCLINSAVQLETHVLVIPSTHALCFPTESRQHLPALEMSSFL